ncbi:MAG TPA: hypothetical protein VMF86_10245 [Stellaceae bacterium]|nr:hypothetical protein [Stellaceae bacterium]
MSQAAAVMTAHDPGEAATAQTVYVLFLVGLIFPLMPIIVLVTALAVTPILGWLILAYALPPIIGLIWTYHERGDASAWVRTHFQMQSRTLWLGLLYGIVAAVATLFFVGWLIAVFILVWWIMRCIKGLNAISRGAPYDFPEHYVW